MQTEITTQIPTMSVLIHRRPATSVIVAGNPAGIADGIASSRFPAATMAYIATASRLHSRVAGPGSRPRSHSANAR
jgi:hypothetical protein